MVRVSRRRGPRAAALALAWLLLASLVSTSCAGSQRSVRLAAHCEVAHNFRDGDEIEGRIDRIAEGWLVSLRMRVQLGSGTPPMEVRGLGRLTQNGDTRMCSVITSSGEPGAPRFDEALCLDEFENLAELIQDAEQTARPGETVVQEVTLRARRGRRQTRSRVRTRPVHFRERAEITRDASGRVVRVVRNAQDSGREEILVTYPPGVEGHCIRAE
jgi:hypothetical protein